MNFKELLEGAEPVMPGAPKGISIMTPQQFVASSGDSKPEEEVDEGNVEHTPTGLKHTSTKDYPDYPGAKGKGFQQDIDRLNKSETGRLDKAFGVNWEPKGRRKEISGDPTGVAEDQEHLDRIRSLSGLGEATKLPAQTRDLDSQEFQDYMKRIVGTPDLDKEGNVKVDKKGNEKYTTGKTKGDKYKMPYIHRSSVVTYLSPDGQTYDEDKIKQTLAIRPKALLKQNEKMKHSNGEFEQFFNVGFAALVGIALDEQTNNLIVVNTCPGAGSCKVDCFAMKGGKIDRKSVV